MRAETLKSKPRQLSQIIFILIKDWSLALNEEQNDFLRPKMYKSN